MRDLQSLLATSTSRHSHLCPRQVLGVRAGLAGGDCLGLQLPSPEKRLLVIVETDGCFVDGIEAATGASVGRRRLRIEDYGKTAVTFVDIHTGQAVRITPSPNARRLAADYAPGEVDLYQAQLLGYQVMPEQVLFSIQPVHLVASIESILSQPGLRVQCARCGEEIINEREIHRDGSVLCRACAGEAYYLFSGSRWSVA